MLAERASMNPEDGSARIGPLLRRDPAGSRHQAEPSDGYDLAARWNRAIEHARKSSETCRNEAERSAEAYQNRLYSISGGAILREHPETSC